MVELRAWGRRPPILPDRQAGSLSHSRPAVPFRARWQALASVKLRRFKHWPRGGSLFDTSVKTVLAASFSAALLTLLLTFARVLGRRYARQSIYTYPRASRSRHRRKVFTEIWCWKSRCVAFNLLQFSASTCIAQNAWMAIECFVLLGERNCCGAFHAATLYQRLHHYVPLRCRQLLNFTIERRTKFGTQNDDRVAIRRLFVIDC